MEILSMLLLILLIGVVFGILWYGVERMPIPAPLKALLQGIILIAFAIICLGEIVGWFPSPHRFFH